MSDNQENESKDEFMSGPDGTLWEGPVGNKPPKYSLKFSEEDLNAMRTRRLEGPFQT